MCFNAPVWFPSKNDPQVLNILSITHVCSVWRQLAFETPRLWNDIKVTLQDEHMDQTISSAAEWLARAKDAPRSLSIHLYGERCTHTIWNQLLKFITLFPLKSLTLDAGRNNLPLTLPNSTWSSIEWLHLSYYTNEGSTGPAIFSREMTLSSLRRLELFACHDQVNEMEYVIPWHQLRSLYMSGMPISLSLCLNVLRQSLLLECCSLAVSPEPSTSTTTFSENFITLNNLALLNLSVGNDSSLDALFRLLVTPNITSLTFNSATSAELRYNSSALVRFIRRSGGMPQIQTLAISDESTELISAGILLEFLPSLKILHITCGFLTENDINHLSSSKIGPLLHSLHLFPDDRHDANHILSMVEERHRNATENPEIDGLCPFKRVMIKCIANEDPERRFNESAALRKKYGIDISVVLFLSTFVRRR
ncbi:hypothetical protein APHAL10511_005102 [Amanita phalloides]|nr:hypothetical protein APHAL10511_005102 [Amanita phalloides]